MIRSRALLTAIVAAVVVSATAQAQVGRLPNMVEPNLATEKELATLPNITPELAKGIVEKRPFLRQADFDAFLATKLTKEQRAQVYARSFVHLNLNTASDEEILMIPGIGAKMLHEFKEYRPYKALAQFRREIGKYVKGDELARLEGYVFVPINLNTASDADILTIPGVGAKMQHEFKEYRPYQNIERFRREIGKYVNAKEVARLERYVSLD